MNRNAFFIILVLLAVCVRADESSDVLACMAGASADIDGSEGFLTDASSIRFILTLRKNNQRILSVNLKHTGVMAGMPDTTFICSVNGAKNLFTCVNGTEVIWYYPLRKHGVIANLNIVPILKESRANAAGIYNYSCTKFG